MVYLTTLSCGSIPLVLLAAASIVTAAPAPGWDYGAPLNSTTPQTQPCVATSCTWDYVLALTSVGVQLDGCNATQAQALNKALTTAGESPTSWQASDGYESTWATFNMPVQVNGNALNSALVKAGFLKKEDKVC